MICKTFSYGSGATGAGIDYLVDGKSKSNQNRATYDEDGQRLVTRLDARLLVGDIDETQQLINEASTLFKNCYTAGVLSFEESNISESDKLEIMASFEECLTAGLESEDYNCLWIEHRDKGRLELNWVIPRIHLTTQMHLQPYFHKIDAPRTEIWQEMTNAKYGLTSPAEPEKSRALTVNVQQGDIAKIKEALTNFVISCEPKSRTDVVEALNALEGVKVVREVKNSVSVKIDGLERNLRLSGALYAENFRSDRDAAEEIRKSQAQFINTSGERYSELAKRYEESLAMLRERNHHKYAEAKQRAVTEHNRRVEQATEQLAATNSRTVEQGAAKRTEPIIVRIDVCDGGVLNRNHPAATKPVSASKKIEELFNGHKPYYRQLAGRPDRETQEFVRFIELTAAANNGATERNRGIAERARAAATTVAGYCQQIAALATRVIQAKLQHEQPQHRQEQQQQTRSRGLR